MIPWIQVYSNLTKHPKIYALADELGLTSKDASPNAVAAGLILSLWLWAAQNAPSGDLSRCTNRAIAEAAEYKKKPDVFVAALQKVKLLDEDKTLHDWDEHASMLMSSIEQTKENNAKRQQRYRDRKKHVTNNESNAEVTVTRNAPRNVTNNESNAPTIPNHTKPNQTLPNHSDNTAGTNTADGTGADGESVPAMDGRSFTEFWKLYPAGKGGDREETWKVWRDIAPTAAEAGKILSGLQDWIDSDQWAEDNGRYIPGAAKFLRESRWVSPPVVAEGMADTEAFPETLAYVQKLMAKRNEG